MISVIVAALLVAAPLADTVYTVDGGRITGTVLEESRTSGVTIQMPDGSVRRVDANQVSRIEFSDGTVSTMSPPPPPLQAREAAPAARAPAPQGPIDTVYFSAGGRVRGTVMEEDARAGVQVRLLDGTIHAYPTAEVSRIEYSDGTVSTPHAARIEPAPPADRPKATEAPLDTVYFLGGGRVRGTVIEEHPRTGVRVRLLDGSLVTYARSDLVRIEYGDGSVSRRKTPETVAVAPAPQPAAAPPKKDEMAPMFPLQLSLGAGATFLGGSAASGVSMSSLFEPVQAHLSSEVALRFTPSFAIGVYGDVGASDPAAATRDKCRAQGIDCTALTGRVGFMVKTTWSPLSREAKWLSFGTGWEFGGVAIDHHGSSHESDLFHYTGREFFRLGGGIDFRSNQVIGFGFYASIAIGEYDRFKDPTLPSSTTVNGSTHTTGQVGLRLILFP